MNVFSEQITANSSNNKDRDTKQHRKMESSLPSRALNATPEEIPNLMREAEAMIDSTDKNNVLAFLTEKQFSARVDGVKASETKNLMAEINENNYLKDEQKEILRNRLSMKEWTRFGNFFTTIDELIVQDDGYNESNFGDQLEFYKSCCRSLFSQSARQNQARDHRAKKRSRRNSGEEMVLPPAQFVCRHQNGEPNDVYQVTYEEAVRCTEAASNPTQGKQSSHGSARKALWPKNVMGEALTPNMQIAHLVPTSVDDAESYWFVTDFLFGYSCREWDERRRLIHGSNKLKGKSMEKVHNTGVKHMITNKILLASQADYVDRYPCVIVVPILPRSGGVGQLTALNWHGEAYDAIMLIDSYSTDDEVQQEIPLRAVARATGYTYCDENKTAEENLATAEEVKMAMDLFREYTHAIHYAQKYNSKKFKMTGNGLFYPKLCEDYKDKHVRKISFASNSVMEGHPAPDPILLLSKSIAVFQARHGFKIMATAEPRADNLPSDQSIQAEEDYLRWREQSMTHRDPLGMDILVG